MRLPTEQYAHNIRLYKQQHRKEQNKEYKEKVRSGWPAAQHLRSPEHKYVNNYLIATNSKHTYNIT